MAYVRVTMNGPRYRILHLIPHASMSRFHQAFWEHLPRERYELDFLSFEPDGPMHRWVRQQGAHAWSLNVGTETRWAPKAFVRLVRFLSERRYDLVHLFGLCSLAAGLPAARMRRIPQVLYNHWYGRELLLYRGNWLSRWIDRAFSPRVDHVIAVSQDLADYLRNELRIPAQRLSLIPFGFDFPTQRLGEDERQAIRRRYGWGDDFVVGCVGRLHWTKGQRYLLEAIAQVQGRGERPIRAIFLGEGPEREALQRYAAELGVTHQVQFLGRQPDVWTYFQLMDVLAHPSLQRAYEQVIAEAMGVGTPVLSTRVGIAREIIVSGENGWLVPERDAAAIAGILGEIAQRPLASVARSALETARQRIGSKRSMVEDYDRLYRRLLNDAGRVATRGSRVSTACPLCDQRRQRQSWMGSTIFRGQEFRYMECGACRSLSCDPMPDPQTVAFMYDAAYFEAGGGHPNIADPRQPDRVMAWLERLRPGTFVDYGCGNGSLLAEADRRQWRAVGVELDGVAKRTAARAGVEVISLSQLAKAGSALQADVLHLGDVIEHLTDMNHQLAAILRLVKPGGLLLAQGPLEANANVFTLLLRMSRSLRRTRAANMPPYHVLLATASGQRMLFARFGLEAVEFSVQEVAWPAPSSLSWADAARPRSVALFVARHASQMVSRLRPTQWGNRYFYVGRRGTAE